MNTSTTTPRASRVVGHGTTREFQRTGAVDAAPPRTGRVVSNGAICYVQRHGGTVAVDSTTHLGKVVPYIAVGQIQCSVENVDAPALGADVAMPNSYA